MTDRARPVALAALVCRPTAQWLAPPSDPGAVLCAAYGSPGLVGLIGRWAGGEAIIAADPLLVLDPAQDPVTALDLAPRIDGSSPEIVGGGWFGSLAFDGPSQLGFYDHVLRLRSDGWYFEALRSDQRDAALALRREEFEALLAAPPSGGSWTLGTFAGASQSRHLSAVEETIEAIRAGEIYQASICTRLGADFRGSTVGLFAAAVGALRPAYGAYVEAGSSTIACLSPELFLSRRGRQVRTSPIKGTAPAAEQLRLRRSAKDAAENIMIVDLMRNDLGAVAEIGSVRVAELLDVQPHAGVSQLVSTITAELRPEVSDADLLRATFPPGSVTGAPKVRALDVIGAVEQQPRGAYTGAVGFVSPTWGAEFNVAIRTFEFGPGRVELGVGGGVTADSVPMLEWGECLLKAAPLLSAVGGSLSADLYAAPARARPDQLAGGVLETILAVDGEVLRLAEHLARLDRSCRELYDSAAPAGVEAELRETAAGRAGRVALRVIVVPIGPRLRHTVTVGTAAEPPTTSAVTTVLRSGGLWRHKWAQRDGYAGDEARHGSPLYVAADGTVLETSRGNVFLLGPDGGLVTPPLRDDLLPGVTRRAVLDLARDQGRRHEVRPFTLDELLAGAAFWTSSLSLAVPIGSVDGAELPRSDDQVSEWATHLAGEKRR